MKSSRAIWVALIVFAIAMALTQSLTYQQYLIHVDNEEEKVTAEAGKISDKFKASLTYSFSATKTLAFYVTNYGVPDNFDLVASSILESNHFIDALELTREGIITHVYPRQENIRAIGYDILKDSLRRQEAVKAIQKKELFFAGPFQLKQGGMAVVGRLPIFKDNAFWGFSVVIIKLHTLLTAAGIDQNSPNFTYQLSKINPSSGEEEFFLPGGAPSPDHTVTRIFPDGEWKLYVASTRNFSMLRRVVPFSLLGLFLSALAGLFAWHLAKKPEQLKVQVEQISEEMSSLQKESKLSLERINRLYHFISRVNHTMIHAENEDSLYTEVCQIAFAIGKYKLVWIGKFDFAKQRLQAIRSSGDQGYLGEVTPISINEIAPDGPEKKLLETKSYVYCNDIAQDPIMKPWADKAIAKGYRSCIILPIKKFGQVVGSFNLYSDRVSYFDDKEINLLVETTNNISFTLENFENEELRRKAEEQIQNEKILSDSIINSLPGVFYLYDRSGKFLRWNKNFEVVTGYSGEEVKTMHPLDFFTDKEKILMQEKINQVFNAGYAEVMAEFHARNGRVIPYFFNGRTVHFSGKDYLIGMGLDMTDRVNAEKALYERKEEIEKLSAHLQNVREEERSHIALEIHDVLGQQLTALKMDATWIRKHLREDVASLQRVSQMIGLIDDTIKTVRKISSQLRPGILDDLGIVAALEWQSSEFKKNTGVDVMFESQQEIDLSSDLAINIFRIYQEALTNIARHAHATRVHASLKERSGILYLEISDDGLGIDFDQVKAKKSLGLISMKERARMFNGVVTVEKGSPKGTVVTAIIPLVKNKKKVVV